MPHVFHGDPARLALPAPKLTPELLEFLAGAYGVRSGGLPTRDLGGAFNLNVAIAEQLADLMRTAELPSQLVHGDFWDNNVLFEGPAVTAVLDLDFAGVRPRVDDLALPQQRAELVDKRGPDCAWWLAAFRDGGMSAVTFATSGARPLGHPLRVRQNRRS